jgi:hypothetical protein
MVDKQKTIGGKKAFKDMFGDPKIYQIDDHGIEDQKAKKDKSRKADKAPVAEGINGEWTKERSRREDENIKAVKKTYGDFRTTVGKNSKEKMKEIAASMNESWVVTMPISDPDKTGKEINKRFIDRGIDYQDMGWDKQGNLTVEFDDEKEAKRAAMILKSFRHSSKNQMPKVMKESLSDLKSMYASSIPEIVDEIKELSSTLIDYYMDQEQEWADTNVAPAPGMYLDWKGIYRGLEDLRDIMLCAAPDELVGIDGTDDMNESANDSMRQKVMSAIAADIRKTNEKFKTKKDVERYLDFTGGDIITKITKNDDDFNNMLQYASEKLSKNLRESNLHEISKERKDSYVKRSATDAGLANFGKRQSDKPDEKKKFGDVERKRRAGLNLALAKGGDKPVYKKESLDEAFSSGSLKLMDGSTYNLTSDEAKALNKVMSSTKEKDRMTKRITKSKSDLKSMIEFSKEV